MIYVNNNDGTFSLYNFWNKWLTAGATNFEQRTDKTVNAKFKFETTDGDERVCIKTASG